MIILTLFTAYLFYLLIRRKPSKTKIVYVRESYVPSNEPVLKGWESEPRATTPDRIIFHREYTIEEYSIANNVKAYRILNPANQDIGYEMATSEDAVFNIELLEHNV